MKYKNKETGGYIKLFAVSISIFFIPGNLVLFYCILKGICKMKFKKLVLLLGAFVVGFMLYFLLFSTTKETNNVFVKRREPVQFSKPVLNSTAVENKQSKLTMKQIDSMTANLNYKFTISNRVDDSIAAVSNVNTKKAEWKDKK